MLKLESKIGTIESRDEKIYNFLTDFNNFEKLVPEDKVRNWEADGDTCRFTVDGIGQTGVRILEKEPFKLIKLAGIDNKFNFYFWIQLKMVAENDTKIRLTAHVDIPPVMEPVAKKPLQKFLNTLVDQLSKYSF